MIINKLRHSLYNNPTMWLYQKKDYTQGHLRNQIVLRLNNGKTYREVLNELWIWSLRTISRRNHRDSLESKSSAPNNPYRKYDFHELYHLFALKKYWQYALDDLIDILNDDYQISIPRSTASYYLNQWKITKSFKDKACYQKFKEYDIWYVHVDITYWPKINWKKMYIYVAIERRTRLIYIEVHDNKKAITAKMFFKNLVEFFPFHIHTVLTDNWKEFTLKNHKWKHDLIWKFDEICTELNIEHRTTLPYTPKTNWMVEVCNWTIKRNTILKTEYKDLNHMKKDILTFMLFYILNRRHWWIVKEIKTKTPYDALVYYYEIYPDSYKEPPEKFKQKLEEIIKINNILLYNKRKL